MVTFLLTDVEGSTRLWEERPDEMAAALAAHDSALTESMARHDGQLIKSRGEGDATFSVFDDPADAIAAALAAQQALADAPFRIRVAIHTGHAEARDGDYFGPTVNRCARLRGAAHGGQVVLSFVTRQLVADRLPPGAALLDLGSHHLKDLTEPERVFQLCHPDLAPEFPPLASLDRRRHNLPPQLTRFFGRSTELDALATALKDRRMVTLVGPGGSGKTRLALEVATAAVDGFGDGVWLAELSTIATDAQVLPTIAATLGVREEPGRDLADSVAKYVEGRELLLVLDNCEHVIDAAAEVADRILHAGENTRVLATSREALRIGGERVVQLGGLSGDAVELFIDRATSVDPHFFPDRGAIADVCRHLDGLPLAIELAAALADRMSVREIADRLPDRLELLRVGTRTAEPRQRSLTAAIDWSYDLLDRAAHELLAAVSVFPSGFDRRAAEAVGGGGAALALDDLVSKSLVVHSSGRYSMLESIRLYAADRLAASGRAGAVEDAAVDWALSLGDDIDVLDAEHENILATLPWATARRPADALRLVIALGSMWEVRGHWRQGRHVIDDVLARIGAAQGRAAVLHRGGRLAAAQGDFDAAERLLRDALALAEETDDDIVIGRTLSELGGIAHMRGNIDEARLHFEAALNTARATGSRRLEAGALGNLGIIAHATGDLERALTLHTEALRAARELNDDSFLVGVLSNAGMVAAGKGDLAVAAANYDEALTLARGQSNAVHIATVLSRLSDLAQRRGDFDTAAAQLSEGLEIFRELGDRPNIANTLYRLGDLARRRGNFVDARVHLEASLEQWRQIGHALGEAAVLLALGEVDRRTGNTIAALENFRQATGGMQAVQNREGLAIAIEHVAAVVARERPTLAAELLGGTAAIRARMGIPAPPADESPITPDELRETIGTAAYEAAATRGAGSDEAQLVLLATSAVDPEHVE